MTLPIVLVKEPGKADEDIPRAAFIQGAIEKSILGKGSERPP
jgi:hypothetical protein